MVMAKEIVLGTIRSDSTSKSIQNCSQGMRDGNYTITTDLWKQIHVQVHKIIKQVLKRLSQGSMILSNVPDYICTIIRPLVKEVGHIG